MWRRGGGAASNNIMLCNILDIPKTKEPYPQHGTLNVSHCRPYLESVKTRCVDSCSRERCMAAVREFYRKIPKQHSLDIAFCLCK